jgi:molybdenum cofactor cytidylyltransferase
MKFGTVPVAGCAGAALAHGISIGGLRLGKGRLLSTGDIQALQDAGISRITVALMESGDLPENEAAARIGAALATPAILTKPASTGRVNLHAGVSGLLRVNAKIINAINSVHPSITVATLPDFAACQSGAMVATVKIIPFAAPLLAVEKVEALALKGGMSLHAYQPRRIGLVQTLLPATKDSVLEKTIEVTRHRLAVMENAIQIAAHCNHDVEALAATLNSMSGLDMVIVFGASAVCDAHDVVPEAIRRIGGTIIHIGMPVDPGNLLVLARKGKTTIIGAPGCARSPKENGFDWVLARLMAGLKVTSRAIIGMGVGGLLMEIPTRPSPRSAPENGGQTGD